MQPRPKPPLRRPERQDDGNAFIADTTGQSQLIASRDAEAIAEEFIGTATGAEPVSMDAKDEVGEDEDGGPFLLLEEDGSFPSEAGEDESEGEVEREDPIRPNESRRGARWAAKKG